MFLKNHIILLLFNIITMQFTNNVYGYRDEISNILSKCHTNDSLLNNCLQNALNQMRPYFETGVPEFGVPSFDPLSLKSMEHRSSIFVVNYRLKIFNIHNQGWTTSEFDKFHVHVKNNHIEYEHYFPNVTLNGEYELEVTSWIGIYMKRNGKWNLKVNDYSQSTTITWDPTLINAAQLYNNHAINAKVNVLKIGDMTMDISNILTDEENFLERIVYAIITSWWRTAFPIIHPHINDILSIGLSKVCNNAFENFPFQMIMTEK